MGSVVNEVETVIAARGETTLKQVAQHWDNGSKTTLFRLCVNDRVREVTRVEGMRVIDSIGQGSLF